MSILDNLSEEDYSAELKELFKTKGWQIFIAEMFEDAERINNIQDVVSEKDLWIRRGELDRMGRVLNYQTTFERVENESS